MYSVKDPLVSVVIPTFNHARFLGRAIQSVLDQTFQNWEAIVIDNHSLDNTDEVVGTFTDPRITSLKIHNNGVLAASRNLGVRVARGEWVAFLDSDDWWAANKLQVCLEQQTDLVDLVYHDLGIARDRPGFLQSRKVRSRQVRKPVLVDLLVNGNAIANSSVLVRRRLLEEIHGIDENPDLCAAEDYNTWLRIARITDAFLYLPRILGYYTIHAGGVSQRDMSIPHEYATSEFMGLLSGRERLKAESLIRYTKGRYAYLMGQREVAFENLLFCLQYGSSLIRLKSGWMLLCTKAY